MPQLADSFVPRETTEAPRQVPLQVQKFVARMIMLVIGVAATALLTLGWAAFLVHSARWLLRG